MILRRPVLLSSRWMRVHLYRMKLDIFRHRLCHEICARSLLLAVMFLLTISKPHQRVIHKEELWKYSNPRQPKSVMPTFAAISIALLLPLTFMLAHFALYKDKDTTDVRQVLLGYSLACVMNGVIVEFLKVMVGRPRPDFFYRCFPNGQASSNLLCTGDSQVIDEGRKSFPSGHTAWFFCCFTFLSLYLASKLQCFHLEGKGQAWKLCLVILPLFAASAVGISRVHDNMHHWDDVVVGGLIGIVSATICYLQYYPSPFRECCYASSYSLVNSSSKLTLKRTPSKGDLEENIV